MNEVLTTVLGDLNKTINHMTEIELIEKAMVKYPKARRIAVMNFSTSYSSLSDECLGNLDLDTRSYGWKSPTVNAIRWVINQKQKLGIS